MQAGSRGGSVERHMLFGLALAALTWFGFPGASLADDRSAAEVLPPSIVLFAEIPNPLGIAAGIQQHPLFEKVKRHEAWEKATSSPDFAKAMIGVSLLEFKLGMPWQKVLATLTGGGIAVAVDAESKGVVILTRSEDEESLGRIVETLVQMARDDARNKGDANPLNRIDYRGVTVYQAKQGVGFARIGSWLAIGNEGELGKAVIDRILDETPESLATNAAFLAARQQVASRDSQGHLKAWAYVNVEPIRSKNPRHPVFLGKADDPAGEVLVGGILEAISKTTSLLAEVRTRADGVHFSLSAPFERSRIGESREHYFGPRGEGVAAPLPQVPGLLLSLTVYRDLSEMWLRAGELFSERVVDKMAEAESHLTTLFSGRDFAEEVLGSVEPQIQVLVARQNFGLDQQPIPAIQLPAFSLVFRLKESKTSWNDLRRIFQSLIGFLNVAGAQSGNPQLDLQRETVANGEVVSASFVRPVDANPTDPVSIHFNFSPAVASSGNLFVLSSSRDLALTILNAPAEAVTSDQRAVNTQSRLNVAELKGILASNREHLISQNMIEKGHSRPQAEQEIGTFLDLLGLVHSVELSLTTGADRISLDVDFQHAQEDSRP